MNSVAKYFRFGELGTNFRTELIAGLTTFVSMAYILFVNPTVLGAAGMDKGCLLYTSPSPRDGLLSRMPSSA